MAILAMMVHGKAPVPQRAWHVQSCPQLRLVRVRVVPVDPPGDVPLRWQDSGPGHHHHRFRLPHSAAQHAVAAREDTLARRLSPRQVSMIALGGAMGTGFFLGSGVSVRLAGPGVILAYICGGFIALVIAWSLAEMAVVHPVAGSFGVYAEIYLHPWAGFTMRYSYWVGVSIAVGSEVVAAAIYCHFWFPHVPGWLWVTVVFPGPAGRQRLDGCELWGV